jgi:hypothetical protein
MNTKKNSQEIPTEKLENKDLTIESLGENELPVKSTEEINLKDTPYSTNGTREITVTFIKRRR